MNSSPLRQVNADVVKFASATIGRCPAITLRDTVQIGHLRVDHDSALSLHLVKADGSMMVRSRVRVGEIHFVTESEFFTTQVGLDAIATSEAECNAIFSASLDAVFGK